MSDPSTTEGSPSLRDLLSVATLATAEGEHRDIPAKVISYTPGTQFVDVQPLVMVSGRNGLKPVAPIQGIQVRWPAGTGWSFTAPLVAGDPGWIRVGGADISAWKMRGIEQDPLAIPRSGSYSDSVFEPGSQPFNAPLGSEQWSLTNAVLYVAGVLLLGGSSATGFIALAAKVVTELQAIRDFFDLHTHPTPAGPSSPPTQLFSVAPPVGNIASSKVKAI